MQDKHFFRTWLICATILVAMFILVFSKFDKQEFLCASNNSCISQSKAEKTMKFDIKRRWISPFNQYEEVRIGINQAVTTKIIENYSLYFLSLSAIFWIMLLLNLKYDNKLLSVRSYAMTILSLSGIVMFPLLSLFSFFSIYDDNVAVTIILEAMTLILIAFSGFILFLILFRIRSIKELRRMMGLLEVYPGRKDKLYAVSYAYLLLFLLTITYFCI